MPVTTNCPAANLNVSEQMRSEHHFARRGIVMRVKCQTDRCNSVAQFSTHGKCHKCDKKQPQRMIAVLVNRKDL